MKIFFAIIVITVAVIIGIVCFYNDDNCFQSDMKQYEYGVFLSTNNTKMEQLKNYNTIVIDAAYFNKEDITSLKKHGHKVYTYLNVGSLENFRPYYNDYSKYTLGNYKNWEEEQWIDVSSKEWQEFVGILAKDYQEKGVDGFFIDNCDVYYTYNQDKIYTGLVEILTHLKNSGLDIVINGGDAFVSKYYKDNKSIEGILTGINQETVFSSINFENNQFGNNSKQDRQYFLSYLNEMDKAGAVIYLLEYTKNQNLVNKIKRYCTQNNWKYYISDSIELD